MDPVTLTSPVSKNVPQYVYLDFDGEATGYRNDALGLDFAVTVEDSGFSEEQKRDILSELSARYADADVIFTLDKPTDDTCEYSTVFVGKSNDFKAYGNFLGLAETVDAGNRIKNDNAFVLLDNSASVDQVVSVAAHELGHILNGDVHETVTGTIDDYADAYLYADFIENQTMQFGTTGTYSTKSYVKYRNTASGSGVNFYSKTTFGCDRYAVDSLGSQQSVSITITNITPYTSNDYVIQAWLYSGSYNNKIVDMVRAHAYPNTASFDAVRDSMESGLVWLSPGESVTFQIDNSNTRLFLGPRSTLGKNVSVISQYSISATLCSTPSPTPTPTSKPDLIVSSLSVKKGSTSTTSFLTTDTITLGITVKNQGSASTGRSFYADIYDGSTYLGYVSFSSLAANSTQTATYTIAANKLSAGSHTLRVIADNDSYVSESNESNNIATSNISVASPTLSKPTTTNDSVSGTTATLRWSGATGIVTGYEVRYATNSKLSGATVKSVSETSTSVSISENGTYYWQVRAKGAYGNWSPWTSPDSFTITEAKDTRAPVKPTTTNDSVSGTTATLRWSGATDNVAVTGYEVRYANNSKLSGATVKSVSGTSTSVSISANGTYYWQVRAKDAAGNWSPWTSPDSFAITEAKDTRAPVKPTTTNDSVSGTTATLRWSGATDNVAVTGYEIRYATNSKLTGATVKSTTATSLNVSGLANGTWYWQVRAKDAAGNWSPWTSPDSFAITEAKDTRAPVKPTTTNDSVSGTTATLRWSGATDNVAVTGYEIRYATNSKLTGATVKSTTATSLNVSGLANGTWYWQVRAKDAAGNWSPWTSPDDFSMKIADTQAPAKPAKTKDSVSGSTATLVWSIATDNVGVTGYEVRYATNSKLTGATVKSTTATSLNVSGLENGTWYWQVRAKDAAGNWSPWTGPDSFAIAGAADTRSPTVPQNLMSWTGDESVLLTWDASTDNVGVTGYEVSYVNCEKAGSPAIVTSTSDTRLVISGLRAGRNYGAKVRACDAASNWSEWTSSVYFSMAPVSSSFRFEDAACGVSPDTTDSPRKFAGMLA